MGQSAPTDPKGKDSQGQAWVKVHQQTPKGRIHKDKHGSKCTNRPQREGFTRTSMGQSAPTGPKGQARLHKDKHGSKCTNRRIHQREVLHKDKHGSKCTNRPQREGFTRTSMGQSAPTGPKGKDSQGQAWVKVHQQAQKGRIHKYKHGSKCTNRPQREGFTPTGPKGKDSQGQAWVKVHQQAPKGRIHKDKHGSKCTNRPQREGFTRTSMGQSAPTGPKGKDSQVQAWVKVHQQAQKGRIHKYKHGSKCTKRHPKRRIKYKHGSKCTNRPQRGGFLSTSMGQSASFLNAENCKHLA